MSGSATFDIQRTQKRRKAALAALIAPILGLTALSQTIGGTDTPLHESVEALGLGLIVICIVGRAWSSLYIGGRKKAEVVTDGPYSIVRNPLYVFSIIGGAGMGAQTGSLSLTLLFGVVTWAVFEAVTRREEVWLSAAHSETYLAYLCSTPRFLPRFDLWRDAAVREVRPEFFLRTLRDGLVFLLAIPLFEGIDALQTSGWLGPLIHLP